MKVLILAAGFGTRLERDLRSEKGEPYAHLIGVPKPLLPIGKHPLVTHWLHSFKDVSDIEEVIVVTNGANHAAFVEWAKHWPEVRLVCEGALTNEERAGAVGCINLVAQTLRAEADHVPSADLLVLAGDTLFYEDFSLEEIIGRFHKYKARDDEANKVLYVTCTDEEVHKYGILETDETGRVVGFLEKPQPNETQSRKECPCFYFFNSKSLPLLQQFLLDTQGEEMKKRDAAGNFINYLYRRKAVYATEISGRFDVGGLESYLVCHQYFLQSKQL